MNTTPSFYSPLLHLGRILSQVEANDGELSPELEAELTITQANLAERTASTLDLIEVAEGQLLVCDAKAQQVKEYKAFLQRFIEGRKKTLAEVVAWAGPIQVDTRKVSVRESVSTVIDDEALIPDELRRPIKVPLQGPPDATAIKARIKAGFAVPGARLQTNQNLTIK